MNDNERIITRCADSSVLNFKGAINGDLVDGATIQLQGLKGDFLQSGFNNIVKVDGLKNGYYTTYESVLEGIKISQLKNYSKIDFAKFIDNELDTFKAQLDNMPVVVKRVGGKTIVFASVDLLVYYA